jgi:serine phosphatase RsbU (regulator of sigma subunit)
VLRDGKVIELESNNTVLGVSPDEIFAQTWFDLQSGDTLLLHTDGLMDAMNFENKTFTRQRVREAFAASNGSAESITQNVLWHMRRFVGLNKPTDDVTMIAAKIL